MVTRTPPEWAITVDSILEKQGRTRSWLARKIGMHETQFSRLMNDTALSHGRKYRLNPETKSAIADALEIPEELIFGSGRNPAEVA